MPDHSVVALLMALAVPYALVLAAPGPNLLLVLWAGLARTVRASVAAALGIACGATLATIAAAYGASLFVADRPLQIAGALVFAAILARSAVRLLTAAGPGATGDPGPGARRTSTRAGGAFAAGLLVALSNPMTVPFFLGFFVSQPLARTEAGVAMACLTVFTMAGLWFAALGLVFSRTSTGTLSVLCGAGFRRVLAVLMLGFAAASLARTVF
jgi:threonine/homoserine/homoserine lactone efflux protein